MKACTVIEKLTDLFCMFSFPNYLHSDQGYSFMSYELKSWLHTMSIPTSKSTRYNPQGNGQVERLNRAIWQAICSWRYVRRTCHTLIGNTSCLTLSTLFVLCYVRQLTVLRTSECFYILGKRLTVYPCLLG